MTGSMDPRLLREWLETDGQGGFASGTVALLRTRRYHALLLSSTTPPTGRHVLVNGFEAWIENGSEQISLIPQHYAPDVLDLSSVTLPSGFSHEPWPAWTWQVNETEIHCELFVKHSAPIVAMRWWATGPESGRTLALRPFLSGRDPHVLHHENDTFRFDTNQDGERLHWKPYDSVPGVTSLSNGNWTPEPLWYRGFLLEAEQERGLDCVEDLAAPGVLRWDLSNGDGYWILAPDLPAGSDELKGESAATVYQNLRNAEQKRRAGFTSPLLLAADSYVVKRGNGKTIMAGYPWFTDWGRDTFIALRGLCLASGRLDDARAVIFEWAGKLSSGMIPNRFTEEGGAEFNSVDASLWFVIVIREYIAAAEADDSLDPADQEELLGIVETILRAHVGGTRYGIRMDADWLLQAGEPGIQLTWMDAKTDDLVVTPRAGKPVEVEALWINALHAASVIDPEWAVLRNRARTSFRRRFWNPAGGYLHDVVDVDGEPGVDDATFRPNQIFAVGGLPLPLLDGVQARSVVDQVEQRLWTPLGLRTLDPDDPAYIGRYAGDAAERDAAYHQGTAWPWLMGPFVEAWIRVRGGADSARREARDRFIAPLLAHLDDAGIGHVSEVADGDAPHTPGGCPFQAWSVGELLRCQQAINGEW